MKKCNKCGREYSEAYSECPFCKIAEANNAKAKNRKKRVNNYALIPVVVVAWICVIAIIVTSVLNFYHEKSIFATASVSQGESNCAQVKDNVIILTGGKELGKGLKEITYNEENNEYKLYYKNTPDEFIELKTGDLFVVPADEDSDNYNFKVGFSGYITNVEQESVSFTIPNFSDLFERFDINTGNLDASDVSFVPADGVELENIMPNSSYTAAVGLSTVQTGKISLGDYSGDVTYKKADTTSQLEGYDLIAKKLSLKIEKEAETDENNDIEISGKVTLNYPAVKFNMSYDGESDNIESYDVGFITNQSVSLKVKGTADVGIPSLSSEIGKYGIVDLKDTSDLESGKIVLGSLFVGYGVPLYYNVFNGVPYIAIGLVFQVCLTASGEIEIECDASESGLLRIESNSNGENVCELKSSSCPNPVLGEEAYDGENYDDVKMSTSVKGTLDFTAAISIDVGFSVLGTIPLKIANDVLNFEIVKSFDEEKSSSVKSDVVEDTKLKDIENVSFYQLKSQSVLKFNVGTDLKIAGIKCDVGEIGFQKSLGVKVWLQYPATVDFSIEECDFGGVQLGNSYTLDEINDIYYEKKKELGKSSLTGKVKDRFLQSTVRNIANKINYNVEDIFELLPISGDYDITCFSDGAIYFLADGVVKAELITGDDVYNNSYISHSSSDKFIRSVYSEPDDQTTITVDIGEIGQLILKEMGMEELAEYDGTNLTIYQYSSDDGANMDVYLDGGGNVIFIVVY